MLACILQLQKAWPSNVKLDHIGLWPSQDLGTGLASAPAGQTAMARALPAPRSITAARARDAGLLNCTELWPHESQYHVMNSDSMQSPAAVTSIPT